MTAKQRRQEIADRLGPVRPPAFQVGDRVRVIAVLPLVSYTRSLEWYFEQLGIVGSAGTVVSEKKEQVHLIAVSLDSEKGIRYYYPAELALLLPEPEPSVVFKPGDRVRIVGKGRTEERYSWPSDMDELIGTEQVIIEETMIDRYYVGGWWFHPSSLEKVEVEPLFEGEFWFYPVSLSAYHSGSLYTKRSRRGGMIRVRVTEIREEAGRAEVD